MVLRPDELAAISEIEMAKSKNQDIKKGLKFAANVGTAALGVGTAVAGAKGLSKVLPFLNEFIPAELALKGISKISPELGKFLKTGQSMGLDLKSGLDFLNNKLKSQASTEQKNIIAQYSDELNNFLQDYINKGRTPLEAGALAQLDPKFKNVIKKIEQDHKTNFSSILQSIFGQENPQTEKQPQQPQQTNANPQQPQQGQGLDPQLLQLMQGIRSSIQNLRGR
jgi:hypothetical protein